MKKILILSDTHSYIDSGVEKYAKSHDEIWHAGDWGNIAVHQKLSQLGHVRGVFGNIDGQDIRVIYPETLQFKCEEVSVFITHIAGYPEKYKTAVKNQIVTTKPKLVICGHSHILKVLYDKNLDHLHINPGAIGKYGFHKVRTMISLEIDGAVMRNMKVIEFDL